MAKLEKLLDQWRTHGIISLEQKQQIITYQQNRPPSPWAIRSFFILGAAAISIGIISLVAANWMEISAPVKLSTTFALLITVAMAIYHCNNQSKSNAYEILIVLFISICLATIGLISQIYHIDGKLYQALFVWSFITLPVVAFSQQRVVVGAWATLFIGASIFMLADTSIMGLDFSARNGFISVLMMAPLFCILVASLLTHIQNADKFIYAFQGLTLVCGLIAVASADIFISSDLALNNPATQWPGFILGLLVLFGLLTRKKCSTFKNSFASGITLLYMLMFLPPLLQLNISLVGFFYTSLLLSLAAIYFGMDQRRKTFGLLTLLVGLRFLVFYFEAAQGLSTTGITLITTGVLMIFLVVLWNKYSTPIQQKLGKVTF